MNLLAVVQFYETIYTSIFKWFLVARSIINRLFRLVSTYFKKVKINKQQILYLNYFV